MPNLSDFIEPDLTTSDVIHSNGYASAASGSTMGAGGGGLSMDQRRKLLYGRQIVGSYSQSKLGQRYGALKARTANQSKDRSYDANSDTFTDKAGFSNRRGGGVKDRGKIDTASVEKRQHFIEPPARGHNPYA